jgi:hypothetical protein
MRTFREILAAHGIRLGYLLGIRSRVNQTRLPRAATSGHHPMRLLIERYQRNWEELPSLLAFIWRARSCAAPYATLNGYEALRKAVGVFELRTSLASNLGAHRCVSWLAVSGRRSCTCYLS